MGYSRGRTGQTSWIDRSAAFSYIDLFCGAGGLSLGFQRAGFRCLRAVDHDEAVVATYERNFQDHIHAAEITTATQLEPCDVLVGGPPCQSFSSAGMRRSEDKRSSLVRVFAHLIVTHRPKAFVFENVEGFLTADQGDRVFDLLEPVIETGYNVHLRKINAANYGVPQHRKRVVAVGGLGFRPSFPKPTHRAYGAPGATLAGKNLPPCPTLMDALQGLSSPSAMPPGEPSGHFARSMSELDRVRLPLLLPGQTMKDLPVELWHDSYRRRANRRVKDGTPTERRGGAPAGVRRLRGDEPSKTITSGATSEFVHPDENRYLTLRECARIQTFPDDFIFLGASNECAIQIGNAVPPKLAEVIALNLMDDLIHNRYCESRSGKGHLLSFIPTPSSGASPALDLVSSRIASAFQATNIESEQLTLWP